MQTFKKGNCYNGFELLEEKKINEVNSIARLFSHSKSGARLLHLENDDNNKVFSISFRTPPMDNTGLPHILEHAVLCGSKKFPLKDPFIELAKGSLNTYLNAMTFSDKTMYPIASQNHKDFINLMDVYLDAVLHPNIYNGPESFMQEGWHYELNNTDEPLSIKGVVYNEMKGAFSSPEQVLFGKIQESLFPDTVYRFESGGDPESIPDLTYEQFLNFHKNYYHPSNSYIYLYGNGNLMEHLKFIDEQYLNEFDKIEVDSSINIQPSFNQAKEIEEVYSISIDENDENKTYISKNYAIGQSNDSEKVLAFSILNYLLLGSPAAPLKKALIEANIGKDVFGSFDSSILQPTLSIIVKNTNVESKDVFLKIIKDTLENIVDSGIDKKLIEAAINIHEFKFREADYGHRPKGLVYNIKAMNTWLYGEDPWLQLEYENSLNNIKTALETNYFEKLIQTDILNNCHSSLLILKPQKGLSNEKDMEEKNRLKEYRQQLSKDEVSEIINQKNNLENYQAKIETDEALSTIPLLSREDIISEVEDISLVKLVEKDVEILHHSENTNGITYVNLFFDTKSVPQELIPYTVLLSSLLGKVRTENHSYEELSNLININTGGIYSKVETFSFKYSHKEYLPKFVVKSSVLTSNMKNLFNLLNELMNKTKFDEINRVKEVIAEMKSRLEMTIFDQGHAMAARRVNSYFSPIAKYIENTHGIEYYMFISNLDNKFNEEQEIILENLKKVFNMIFNKNNMLISITAEENDFKTIKEEVISLIEILPSDKLEKHEYSFDLGQKNEGLLTSGKVQYVAKGYNFKELGYEYSGHMQVLKTIVSLDYLWNKIRVAGGAYGSLANFSKNGNLLLSSYRDPNLEETFNVYDNMFKYIEDFNADEREMRKYIIGTISNMDTPLSPFMKGDRATNYYISGTTLNERQIERNQVLSTTVEDIKKYSSLLTDVMKENYLCVLGNEDKIRNNKKHFKNFVKVFQ